VPINRMQPPRFATRETMTRDNAMRVVVLASGAGSNLRSLAAAIQRSDCHAEIVAVVSDRPGAPASEFARSEGIATDVVPLHFEGDREAWNEALARAAKKHAPELIVLAGFMRILGGKFLDEFPGRVINIHPSILPAFRGKDAPAQAVAAGVRLSGCSVHVVTEEVDAGAILAQAAVPVSPDDDASSLHRRIQRAEHRLLPAVVNWIGRGILALDPAPSFTSPPADVAHSLAYPEYS